MHRSHRTGVRRATALLLCLAVLAGACSGDDDTASSTSAPAPVSLADYLGAMADDVIVPSYQALTGELAVLGSAVATLCSTPSADALEGARAGWRDANLSFQRTRAAGVGPATDRRLVANAAFAARPDDIEALLASTAPVDPSALAAGGAHLRGLNGVEVALFAPGSDSLTTAAGARRCTYAQGAVDLVRASVAEVLADWTGGYRATWLAGMDGDPQSSLEAIVNEVNMRLHQIDIQGLRNFIAMGAYDQLTESRREGPAAQGIATLQAVYAGLVPVLLGVDDGPGLVDVLRSHSADTAERLAAASEAADELMGPLVASTEASFADLAPVDAAQEAVNVVRVLVSTEVASQLGVTISFSDTDGDS